MKIKNKTYTAFAPVLIFLFLSLAAGCGRQNTEENIKDNYTIKIIGSVSDHPLIDLTKSTYKELIILLHYEKSAAEIKKFLHLSEQKYDSLINNLFAEGLIRRSSSGKFFPSFMVITGDDAKTLTKTAEPIGMLTAEIVKAHLQQIKTEYDSIISFRNIPFDSLSLFILSDVSLSKWQIKNIETKFLKSLPPAKGNKHYYLSMQKMDNSDLEPFENYYDYSEEFEGFTAANYSNKRTRKNFLQTEVADSRKYIDELKIIGNKYDVISIPVINRDDLQRLKAISELISNDLIELLEKNRSRLRESYLDSIYKNQSSFREYLIWVYQFIIREATNRLIEEKLIHVPASGEQPYVILSDQYAKKN